MVPSILYIEDNPSEIRLFIEIIELLKTDIKILTSNNGMDGMDLLLKKGPYKDSLSPHLIFTDINIPKKNGFELLREIKKHESLKLIPIVILTSSEYPEDIMLCYTLNANAVVYKHSDIKMLLNHMKCIMEFFIYNPFSYYNTIKRQVE